LNYGALRRPSGPAAARLVNHARLGDALLNMQDPPLRGLFVAANNPAVSNPDAAAVRRGLARDDLFTVVHSPFMTATARYADIVLPATTYLETEDFYRAYGTYFLQYGEAAVPPQGDAWSNLRLAQELARRMGLDDAVFGMSPPELLDELFRGATGPVAALDPAAVRASGPVQWAVPQAQEFRTPSGRLEFYSEQMAAAGLAPLPDWQPDPQEQQDAAKWPLRLLTAPGYFQAHTAYAGVAFLRRREGEPYCVLHPDEAGKRGLSDGARVRLHNERGSVGLMLRISDEVLPGVVLVPGQRPDGETLDGTINLLCSDRYTDIGEGATYQSTFLDVTALSNENVTTQPRR
jgi:anaerobic selenocysteine-containing dehydrogenase